MVWYRGFYIKHPEDVFPKAGKESGGYWEGLLEGRYEKLSSGYHMLTYFQCNICHFRNIKGRGLNRRIQEDDKFIIAVRREYLDAF